MADTNWKNSDNTFFVNSSDTYWYGLGIAAAIIYYVGYAPSSSASETGELLASMFLLY